MTRISECHSWRFFVYGLAFFTLCFVCGLAVGGITIDYVRPNIIVADKDGVPIDGVPGSVTELSASEKIQNLHQDGAFLMIRPPIMVKISGNEAVVLPLDGDADGVADNVDQCLNTPPNTVVDAAGCEVVVIPSVVDADVDGVLDDVDQCLGTPSGATVDAVGCEVAVLPPVAGLIQCPDVPTSVTAQRMWTVCDVKSSVVPGYTANENQDYLMSYRVDGQLSVENKGRLVVYMHPSTPGDQFVSGISSFNYTDHDAVEIHTTEQSVYGNSSGSWWGYSGFSKGGVDNYNGKIIAASLDYVLSNHGDVVDLAKGLRLKGSSLGGAGAYIQAFILPDYAEHVAISESYYGLMMIPKNNEDKVKIGWGSKADNPAAYDSIDVRLHWGDVQNVHFHWAGGQNDGLGRMDQEFMDICELRKISCSMRWLQSGHGVNEPGYDLPHVLFLDPNQDVTLDKILPVITNNTSNHREVLRGYYNRGVSWHHANIVDTADEIQVPLQYVAAKNIGPELPAQPDTMTFSLTLRHVKNFPTLVGQQVDWTFGSQSGTAEVGGDGLLTVDGLALNSGAGYEVFTAKKP